MSVCETISSFGIEQSVAVTACVRVCKCVFLSVCVYVCMRVYLPQVIIILLLFLLSLSSVLPVYVCAFRFDVFPHLKYIHTMIIYCVRASERIVLTRAANNSTQLN